MIGVKASIIRVECDSCGHKQRLERRYFDGELERTCICHQCEMPLKVDLSDFATRPVIAR